MDMPHYVGEAIERAAPGQIKVVRARGGEAVTTSLCEASGYYVSYFALEGLDGEDLSDIEAKLRWEERFYDDGLRAGLRFSELCEKLPKDPGAKPEKPRFSSEEEIPRWKEVEDFLFS
jgi:hypothetical protein